jgi:hypothetical protein
VDGDIMISTWSASFFRRVTISFGATRVAMIDWIGNFLSLTHLAAAISVAGNYLSEAKGGELGLAMEIFPRGVWKVCKYTSSISINTTEHVVQFSLVPVRLNDMLDLLEGLEEQTVKTKWMTAEIDRITALIYFIVTISVFIVAIAILPGLLHKFSQVFQDIEFVRLGILAFSVLALSTVAYMLILRIRRLLDKVTTVFL